MRYRSEWPIAVFLGPSLPLVEAQSRLRANYYPPVEMGDIYRLLASGVETIAIIDGVFHQSTPVWQREILTALEEGIQVVGGGSMGALRAAELARYGMQGVGTVFEWYRDGVIDGDDEVALLHLDATFGYRALSEALVNMRFNLERARRRGLVSSAECAQLLCTAKDLCFSQRTWRALLQSPPGAALPDDRRECLAAFIAQELRDLKQRDALQVIDYCAQPTPRPAQVPTRGRWSYPGTVRSELQCGVAPDGTLVGGAEVLRAAISADAAWAERCEREARANFFLVDWLDRRGIEPSHSVLEPPGKPYPATRPTGDDGVLMRANGITRHEWQTETTRRARVAWLHEKEARTFGLNELGAEVLDLLAALFDGNRAQVERAAAMCLYLQDWAHGHGIVCPPDLLAERLAAWERSGNVGCRREWLERHGVREQDYIGAARAHALADWLLDAGPAYFGFATWSPDAALLRDLQLSGRFAELAAALAAAPTQSADSAALA